MRARLGGERGGVRTRVDLSIDVKGKKSAMEKTNPRVWHGDVGKRGESMKRKRVLQ